MGLALGFSSPLTRAYQMNDVAVILSFFVKFYLYIVTVAAQVIACQIYQHYMFRIFFGISQ